MLHTNFDFERYNFLKMRIVLHKKYAIQLSVYEHVKKLRVQPPYLQNLGDFSENPNNIQFVLFKHAHAHCFKSFTNSFRMQPRSRSRVLLFMPHYKQTQEDGSMLIKQRKIMISHTVPDDIDDMIENRVLGRLPESIQKHVLDYIRVRGATHTGFNVIFDTPGGIWDACKKTPLRIQNFDKIVFNQYALHARGTRLYIPEARLVPMRNLQFGLFADGRIVTCDHFCVSTPAGTAHASSKYTKEICVAGMINSWTRCAISSPYIELIRIPEYKHTLIVAVLARIVCIQRIDATHKITTEIVHPS